MSGRLVRCPKCRQILQELPDVLVYTCGGCGTFLQAKIRHNNANSTTTGLLETVTAHKNKMDLVYEDKESSSSHGAILYSSGECSQDRNNVKDQKASGDFISKKQLTGVNLTDEDQNNGIDQNESGRLPCGQFVGINLLNEDPKYGSDQIGSAICDNEPVGGVNFPNEDQNNGNNQSRFSYCNDDCHGISDGVGNQNESADCSQEQAKVVNLPSERLNYECDQNGFKDSDGELAKAVNLPSEGQNNGIDQKELPDCNIEHSEIYSEIQKQIECQDCNNEQFGGVNCDDEILGGVNSSNKDSSDCNIEQPQILSKVCSTTECSIPENEYLPPLAGENSVKDRDKNTSLAVAKKEISDTEDDSDLGSFNSSGSIRSSAEHRDQSHEIDVIAHSPTGVSISSDRSSPNEHLVQDDDNADIPAGENISSDILRCAPNELEQTQISAVASPRKTKEGILLDSFISSPNEHLERVKGSVYHGYNHRRSSATFEPKEIIDRSSELSGALIDLSKSPTTKSSRAYYGDGVSSYEGTDDQLPGRHKHSLKHAYKASNYAASEDKRRKSRFLVNKNSEMQPQLRSYAAIMSDETQYAMKSSKSARDEFLDHQTRYAMKSCKLDRDKLLEPTRLAQNWRQSWREEYLPHLPLYERALVTGYENGKPSNNLPNEFPWNSTLHSLDKAAGTELEKIKILRMIHQLQDQVNILKKQEGRVPHWIARKEHIPLYYDHETADEENFHNFNSPRYLGRFGEGSKCLQHSKYSLMPFSAEMTGSRHQFDHSLRCCFPDWKVSAQLHPHGLRPSEGFCRVHSHPNIYNSYASCPASPQQHVESDFLARWHGTKSGEQRLRGREIKKYLREKHHFARQHLWPIAGGAPFITCFSCFKPLKLPEDFLLKRKCNRLRCGSCSEVLEFSIGNRTRLVPYSPTVSAPPAGEVHEHSEVLNRRNLALSHPSKCSHGDPMSCSEDYGPPFCKSCSTDGDPVYQRPFHAINGNSADSNVPHEHNKETTFVLNKVQNRRKNSVEMKESGHEPSCNMRKSKKVSSEIEQLSEGGGGGGGFPLHRLMGYDSPSQVINGAGYGPRYRS